MPHCDHQEFGALARPVLVALDLRPDGRNETVDFRLATAGSAVQWEACLGDRARRGLEMLGNEQGPRAFTFCGDADSAGAREVAQGS